MARLLALEWDDREARVAVGSVRGGRINLEQAFGIPLTGQVTTKTAASAEAVSAEAVADETASVGAVTSGAVTDIGQILAAALAEHGLSRTECLIAVGRQSIELKNLQLPPGPDDELPDLVRFQALREFNNLSEDWPLDYIPLAGDVERPRSVVAAAIPPQRVEQILATCTTANIQPLRLVLRPCGAASLLRRQEPEVAEQACLLIDLLADETDLTVLHNGTEIFLRTARVKCDPASPDGWQPLLVEVRRTIGAAANLLNLLGGEKIEAIYLCGDGKPHAALADQIQRELGLTTRLFDPFAGLSLTKALRNDPPRHPGRFAPLLGMLADEAAGTRPAIDFLHPRKKAEAPSRRNSFALAALAVVLVVALGAFWIWNQHSDLDNQITKLTEKSKQLNAPVTHAAALQKDVAEIEKWTDGEVVWLDELQRLSTRFPKAQQAVVTQLRTSSLPSGGEVQLEGAARSAQAMDAMQQQINEPPLHRMESKQILEDNNPRYPWRFKSAVVITPPEAQDHAKPQSSAHAKPASSAAVGPAGGSAAKGG